MRIQKINDNQVKILLSPADLAERNIQLTELRYADEKTHQLFREMMEQVMNECDFHAENTSLMIEAVPLSKESMMIIVTKVAAGEEMESKLNFLPGMKEASRYKSRGFVEPRVEIRNEDNYTVFSFASLDDCSGAASRLFACFSGASVLYKLNGRYFLVLQNNNPEDRLTTEDLENVLHEYGTKHISTGISKSFLSEHGEIIIKAAAVDILAKYLA